MSKTLETANIVDTTNNKFNDIDNTFKFTQFGFKNRIINGDPIVSQRGKTFRLSDELEFTIDRWLTEINNGEIEIRHEELFSPTAGSMKDSTDFFGDGSQHNLWIFDGTADDLNGNNNGTLNGDAGFVDDVMPFIGKTQVLTLDGDGDFVSTDFKIGTQTQYTLSAWFKTDNSDMNGKIIANLDSGADYDTIRGRIAIVEGNIELSMGDGNGHEYKSIIPPYNICNNTWHHIVVSIDGYNQMVYLNGKKIENVTFSISAGTDSDGAYSIGREGEADQFYFNGQIGRTYVFLDKALTEDEVRKLYLMDSKYYLKHNYHTVATNVTDDTYLNPVIYNFEGKDIFDLADKDITISFDFKSTITGDFSLALVNQTDVNNRESYVTEFNYSNTEGEFEKVSVTIPMYEFNTIFRNDENKGISIFIANTGSDGTDTEGINSGLVVKLNGTVDLTTGDEIYVSNLQLEEGTKATVFERLPFETQIKRCERYFEYLTFGFELGGIDDGNYFIETIQFKTVKRVNPIITTIKSDFYQMDGFKWNDSVSFHPDLSYLNFKEMLLAELSPSEDDYQTGCSFKISLDSEIY